MESNNIIDQNKLIETLINIKNLYLEKESIKEEFIKINDNYNSLLDEKRLEKEELDELQKNMESRLDILVKNIEDSLTDSMIYIYLILFLPFKLLLILIILGIPLNHLIKTSQKLRKIKLDICKDMYYTKWQYIQNKEHKKLCDIREKYHKTNSKYQSIILDLNEQERMLLEEFISIKYLNDNKEKLQTNESVVETDRKLIKSPN